MSGLIDILQVSLLPCASSTYSSWQHKSMAWQDHMQQRRFGSLLLFLLLHSSIGTSRPTPCHRHVLPPRPNNDRLPPHKQPHNNERTHP
jgi:hypothetical protein